MNGETVDLESLRGKVVLITFWSTKCAICISEIPKLNQMAAGFKDRDVVFLGQGTLAELQRLQGRQVLQLTLDLEKQLETVKRGRFEQRNQQINRVFDDYRQWVHNTLPTEPQPWIQVLAAVCHPQGHLPTMGA